MYIRNHVNVYFISEHVELFIYTIVLQISKRVKYVNFKSIFFHL